MVSAVLLLETKVKASSQCAWAPPPQSAEQSRPSPILLTGDAVSAASSGRESSQGKLLFTGALLATAESCLLA